MAIDISAGAGIVTLSGYYTLTLWPAPPRDYSLDLSLDLSTLDDDVGVGIITLSGTGTWLNTHIFSNTVGTITLSGTGEWVDSFTIIASTIGSITLSGKGEITTEAVKRNWVKWSKGGSLDFTISRGNVAGERALDWEGFIYSIRKLNNKVVVYGENGISMFTPAGVAFGLDTIYRIGLKSKQAVCGDDTKHFYIDKKGQLWKIAENLEKLDYSEYLYGLNNVTMHYDNEKNLVYICDGITGYVYNPEMKSLGSGYANITGYGYQGGISYFTSPSEITTPSFNLCTDIYDFNTRAPKDIWAVEVGTNIAQALKVSIDYRRDKASSFSTTPWSTTNALGVAFLTCHCNEFRVKIKADDYEEFEPDFINVYGAIYGY